MKQRGIIHHQQMQNMFTNANGYVERHKHRQEQVQKQKALQMQKQKALQMQKQKALQMQRQKVMRMQMQNAMGLQQKTGDEGVSSVVLERILRDTREKERIKKQEQIVITHYYDKDLSEGFAQEIYFIGQFYIDKHKIRQQEILYCLKQVVNNNNFKKIYLLNERIYTEKELGLSTDEMKRVIQINMGHRLKFKDVFTEVKRLNLKGYIVFGNSDIFFDDSIRLVRETGLDQKKRACGLSRFEYSEGKKLEDCKLYKPSHCSADVWIYHTNYSPSEKIINETDFHFGKPGCDNIIGYIFKNNKYEFLNIPYTLKVYHFHTSNLRNYNEKDYVHLPHSWTAAQKFVIKHVKKPYIRK